ncbi:MAG: hypothetical protein QW292_03135 [Candidatus Parvarchaeota archaeon]
MNKKELENELEGVAKNTFRFHEKSPKESMKTISREYRTNKGA